MQSVFSFIEEEAVRQEALKLEKLWSSWKRRGWDGPEVGGECQINICVVQTLNEPDSLGRTTVYAYMENCWLLEERPDGTWLGEISMGMVQGEPWPKDGTKVILKLVDMDPPRKLLYH